MNALILMMMALSSLLMLPLMSQPLSLGLFVMISTLFMCLISGMVLSSWYGYILFLIYVGGLLVMFAYVAALSPNILFGRSTPMMFFFILLPILALIFYSLPLIDSSSLTNYFQLSSFKVLKTYGIEMVSPHMISVLIGLAVILLVNLIVVVKVCFYQHASLRPYN
uniref:NADH dehydrogenase subunit 6 n=1 Tax=Isara chinensis TaxID=2774047 RepID=A0A7L7SD30_9CAEN|nr:NADH dehydrogenase subunit 6 [Isara chinensis]